MRKGAKRYSETNFATPLKQNNDGICANQWNALHAKHNARYKPPPGGGGSESIQVPYFWVSSMASRASHVRGTKLPVE